MLGIIANHKHIITMNKKEYLSPITEVFELEFNNPVCQGSAQTSGALSDFTVDDSYTPVWE